MTIIELLPVVEADARDEEVSLLDAYAAAQPLLACADSYRRVRVRAAQRFLTEHPDPHVWMSRSVDERLADIATAPNVWPLITFALISTRLQTDAEFLLRKGFGHTMRHWVSGLYPHETRLLREAAPRIGITPGQADTFVAEALAFVIAFTGTAPAHLTDDELVRSVQAVRVSTVTEPMRRSRSSKIFGLRKLLFEAGLADCPPAQRREGGPLTRQQRLATTDASEIRRTFIEYLDARSAVLRPKTIAKLTSALAIFGEYLSDRFPDVTTIDGIERRHVQAFLTWTATRECRNYHHGRTVGPFVTAHAAIVLRGFFDDITEWGWPQAPARRLMFTSDIPKQPKMLPRALAPDTDAALMAAVATLDDLFARVGLTVLRGTGLRIGELLELELDAVVDFGPAGTWLRVPLGKLNNERMVPLDATTIAVLDEWFAHRRQQRAMPHPRDGRPTDFVFVENGRHLGPARIQQGLRAAIRGAGLTGPDGRPIRVVAHQLRHTYATSLVNAGMSLQALMSLLGHSSPEMTIRYAQLASPTLRAAYDQAIGKLRRRIPVSPVVGGRVVPTNVEWLRSEMLKTRVAHGHCSRDLAAEACAYANICETCPNFTTTPEFLPAIRAQLDDVRRLRDDAHERGWTSEVARHQRVIDSLDQHLRRLDNDHQPTTTS
ncbi:MAG: tyrosine-type recombinase/integrase [Ilumatobacteraceae bacterium]